MYCKVELITVIFKYKKIYLNGLTTNYLVCSDKVREDCNRRVSVVISLEAVDNITDLFQQDAEFKFVCDAESKPKVKDGYTINQYTAHSIELQ